MTTCLDCGWSRPHKARGLCQRCYDRHHYRGTLSLFVEDWDDLPILLERAYDGERVRLVSPIHRRMAVQYLTERGLSGRVIGERLGITRRAVCRLRDSSETSSTRPRMRSVGRVRLSPRRLRGAP